MALAAFRCRPRPGCKKVQQQKSIDEDIFGLTDSVAYPSHTDRPPLPPPVSDVSLDIESAGDQAELPLQPDSEPPSRSSLRGGSSAASADGSVAGSQEPASPSRPRTSPAASQGSTPARRSPVGSRSPQSPRSPTKKGVKMSSTPGSASKRDGVASRMLAGCKPPAACKMVRGMSGEYMESGELESYAAADDKANGNEAGDSRKAASLQKPLPGASPAAVARASPWDGAYCLMEDSDEEDTKPEPEYTTADILQMKESIHGLRWALSASLAVMATVTTLLFTMAYEELDEQQQAKFRHWAMLASIPIVALLFTWFHIWLAIQMMFLPLDFIGLYEFEPGMGIGWQGVVPRKSRKMAKTAYSCARPYLDGPRDWLMRVNPKRLVGKTRKELSKVIGNALNRVGPKHFPLIHKMLPEKTRQKITDQAVDMIQETCPELWIQIVELLCDKNIGIDNDGMIVKIFTENKDLLNRFFLSLGDKEFRFIERCGACMGFVCGVVQLVAFNHLSPSGRAIFLPTTGFFLGIFTNWLAILMVFKPCFPHPVKIFGVHIYDIQGLFLKRQTDVAALYAKMLCDHFLAFHKVVAYLQTQEELWKKLKVAYTSHSTKVLRETLGLVAKVAPLALGQQQYDDLEADMERELVQGLYEAEALHDISAQYIGRVSNIEASNREALRHMPPDEFENLLHPVFQEDEWILILLGGILGAIVGLGQVYVLSN